jgi:zona occludens toxin
VSKRFSDPITLFSGLPGHGKTLMAVTYAREAREEGQRVFQIGIKDCNPVVAEPWELGVERWRELPSGAILILDEAQDFLPVRGPGKPPEWISEIARLRHYGVQLWLITQDVRNLDSFVRRLIGAHVHIERKLGLKAAVIYRWEHVTEDTRDYHARKASIKSTFKHDTKNYQYYTSATQHLVKRKIPWQIWVGIPVVIACIVACYFAFRTFTGQGVIGAKPVSAIPAASATAVSATNPLPGMSASSIDRKSFAGLTPEQYASLFVPRLSGLPWTAPIYDDRKVVSEPQVYCVAVEHKPCRCYSEQMTPITTSQNACLLMAREGVYNPFRASHQEQGRDNKHEFSAETSDKLPEHLASTAVTTVIPGSRSTGQSSFDHAGR